jgi:hypothetical protein
MSTVHRMPWLVSCVALLGFAVASVADVGEPVKSSVAPAKTKEVVKAPAQEPWANLTIPRGQANAVLVIPAQETLVQFAFDIARIRPLLLVAYDDRSTTNIPSVHVWNEGAQDWTRIASKQYITGQIFDAVPPEAIVLGPDRTLPPGMAEKPAGAAKLTRQAAVDLVALVNLLNERFQFTLAEWHDLAGRYGFKLRDLNEERRRYGKYGKPGEKKGPQVPLPPARQPGEGAPAPAPTAPDVVKPTADAAAPENK